MQMLLKIILGCQLLGPIFLIAGLRSHGIMDDYSITKTNLKCLGRNELAFDFDLDDDLNPSRYLSCPAGDSIPLWSWILCQSSFLITCTLCCNLFDIYFLVNCFQLTREQTESVKSLLSMETFESRKR